ncbi:prepilin-type N-terminal cleavage/methylation domain-containing protein [Caminibacter pacificus]|uniref:Prepilin-type N-terminal cleavage/methylation domain-containing protein n=1 Tax=Caminibacter pacificus TaxID=1424653 RepID=A0AAJ4UYB6_9BACT|nr:prepilin-type N-terminal cleavage/methylation domain-containing protein [Caminibacter pacificus]NPA88352.1 prepilin-type N-terminal cleavage/methylation domain-containing protein [Campylobacterota bacterium]QCI28499.1 prepilin-type N-terminal cleavage/methylation domain-containing protein [Caminibacter pacificus]ROR40775.1 prepilin-type N-terminal cleavage/methylation domain-containing protein [Caminibacter pacificus]
MKKAFTLIEILVVLIIVGILATITTQIIYKVYQNYYISRALNKLSFKTDIVLNMIASKMTQRVPNSTIAVECNATNGGCANGNVLSYKSVSLVTPADAYKYPVLEWLAKDVYSKRGIYDDAKGYIVPGWAGFVDLINTVDLGNDEYNISMPFSNFNIVENMDSNWTAQWGVSTGGSVFAGKYEVLIFSGADDRGDFSEVNSSYGYYNGPAQNVFQVKSFKVDENKTVADVKAISTSNSTMVFEGFYLVNSAMAIVPVYNPDTKDFNLTLRQNYYPWNSETYVNGNSTLISTHVTQFRFREQNGIMRIYICISDPKVKAGDEKITICKEKVVF